MIPMVKGMLPVFQQAGVPLEQGKTIWCALALGACLGGNGTLVEADRQIGGDYFCLGHY